MELALILSYSVLGFLVISTTSLTCFQRRKCRLLLIVGLLFSYSFTRTAVISVLMWYFTYYGGDLVTSAIVSNIQESLSSLFVLFIANSATSFVGRFKTAVMSNTAYIGGLMIFWMFNPYDVYWLIVVGLVLLAIGTSGDILLEDILIDLINELDMSQARSRTCVKFWSRVANAAGAISAIIVLVTNDRLMGDVISWRSLFFICMVTMFAFFMIFCMGQNEYRQSAFTRRPVEMFYRVICKKIFRSSSWYLEDRTRSYEQDCEEVKSLSRMLPMWLAYAVICLISATGSTFFLEQFSNLSYPHRIPIQIYSLPQAFSCFIIPLLYQKTPLRDNEKVEIGIGMVCAIVSCIFAWQVEIHRLREVKNLDEEGENVSMSFLLLMPQFCMLGFMEGLTEDGLLKFFELQIQNADIKREMVRP